MCYGMVVCPQCSGQDVYCTYCDGAVFVSHLSAEEWHRQNDTDGRDLRPIQENNS